ncbi:MAG: hypothetical protein J3R72DRAFT_86599 [Linnemannia gamsii]|nr:MAG: hypothetical protein J3R72DRAFT_86599 [Linnemannia gamsii]
MATLEAFEEASTYIVHFRASRPRRSSSAASSSSTSPSTGDGSTWRSFEHHVSVTGAGAGGSVSTSYITSRTRSDSAPSTPPSAQFTTTTTTTRTTTSNVVGENNNDTTTNNNSSAVGYRETTMLPHAPASLIPTAVDAVMDSDNNNDGTLLSAHWLQAQSDSEPYSGSLSTDATIAPTSTATAATTIVRGGDSSITTVTQDSTNILYQPKQERGSEVEGDDADSFDPDCAICLDRILPLRHAKAVLACRHEFHLSCIS